jgi:hypothetical protein
MEHLDPNKLYALIIGNNTYPAENGWHSLKGAVPDAHSFALFLHNTYWSTQK